MTYDCAKIAELRPSFIADCGDEETIGSTETYPDKKSDKLPCIIGVDDQEIIRRMVKRTMRREAHQIITAESGDACLELFENPDNVPQGTIIMTDYQMPGMNGLQLAQRIREMGRDDITIILNSGGGYTETALDEAMNSGIIDNIIEKPFDVEVAQIAVRNNYALRKLLQSNKLSERVTSQ